MCWIQKWACLRIRSAQNDAKVTTTTAYTKEEFAIDLIGRCVDALLDIKLGHIVQEIRKELVTGRSNLTVPDEVHSPADEEQYEVPSQRK